MLYRYIFKCQIRINYLCLHTSQKQSPNIHLLQLLWCSTWYN